MEPLKDRWDTFLRALILTWLCLSSSGVIARNIERYDTAYACEGKWLKLECKKGELISLIRANYGRFSITICNDHGNTDWSVNCMSSSSYRVLYKRCNNQQNCSVEASTKIFGEPCSNTQKYLEAHYQCLPASTTTTSTRPSPPPVQSTASPSKPPPLNRSPSRQGTLATPRAESTTEGAPSSSYSPASSTIPRLPGVEPSSTAVPHEIGTSSTNNTPSIPTSTGYQSSRAPPYRLSTTTDYPAAEPEEPTPVPGNTGDPMCQRRDVRKLSWSATRLGATMEQKCPDGTNGMANWTCAEDPERPNTAVWHPRTPDLSRCKSVWLTSINNDINRGDDVVKASGTLSKVTHDHDLYGGDVILTVNIMGLMADRMPKVPLSREDRIYDLVQGVVTTGSNLLEEKRADAWEDLSRQSQTKSAVKMLEGLEINGFLSERNVTYDVTNILMEVWVGDARQLKKDTVMFPRQDQLRNDWSQVQVEMPTAALIDSQAERDQVKIVFMTCKRVHKFLPPRVDDSTANGSRIVNSHVVSVSLHERRNVSLKRGHPVRLYFQHLELDNVTNPTCVYWDIPKSDWSKTGCYLKQSNRTHSVCECEHLTNFAVLMDVHGVALDPANKLALHIITYVGCSVSIVCLVLAIITFQLFRGLKSDRTTIHKNLCVCLLIAEVLFICGIEQTSQRIVCGVVAGLLHFFFLCAFAWMFLEGFQIYVMLIEVFEAEKSRLRWYYLSAYGLPLLVVAASCVINPQGYGTEHYCWLKTEDYFIFSFVGPVILVLLANLVFLSMAIYMMCRHANTTVSMKSKEHSRLASASGKEENALPNKLQAHLVWLRGAIVLVFLLGLTWTFGLLYMNRNTLAMAYIFTVLNSLQGLFIFVFHCVQNEKVRKEYRKYIRRNSWMPKCLRCSKDGSSSSGTGSGSGGPGASNPHPGSHSGKNYGSHNTSSIPSGPMTDSSGLSAHNAANNSNNISSKPHARDLEHEVAGSGHHSAMTLQGYSLRARERRLLAELEVGSRATTGRRATSPYNHFYTEIREQQLQQQQQQQAAAHLHHHHHHHHHPQHLYQHHHHHHHQQQQSQDDPVYEEIERATGQASDVSDEDGRRVSDMSRQSSRSYGDHRPLIPYSPNAERGGLEAAWAIERLRRQQQQHHHHQQQQQQQQQQLVAEQQLRPQQDHTRTVAVLDGHTVVCHLQPQAELYAARGLAPPSYSEC
ncbi:latrophilin Cirl isoform X2 [Copidosoma floridanum]|uniref:latrophilin Cirl isoform X2 n=1 Tax=Copidosoma floridanum TaxID=29053 RepID=UPI0006C9C9BB|nr:latrophilin Cirl isoform X2 [Copidosoma floridanum]